MYSLPPLTPPQEQVLALISAGATISDAAQSAGVHRNTVHHWIHSVPEFRPALARARDAKALFWRDQAEQLAASAVDTIRTIMTEASMPAAVRLKAAQSILALAMAPPPDQPSPSLIDLTPSAPPPSAPEPTPEPVHNSAPLDAPSPAPALEPVHNSAQPLPDVPSPAPQPPPEPVHNSAQPEPDGPQPLRRIFPKIGRNDTCPCGSGKKFKRCCLNEAVLSATA